MHLDLKRVQDFITDPMFSILTSLLQFARVVNGALGGMFIKTLKDILEAWDINQDF